jgi:mRNA interferase RelE/StbE
MAYKLLYSPKALKILVKLAPDMAETIRQKMLTIAENPFGSHSGATKMQNSPCYRLRVSQWRVVYEIRQAEVIVLVVKIGLRKEVYR